MAQKEKRGRPRLLPQKQHVLAFKVDQATYAVLEQMAKDESRTLSAILRLAIKAYLAKER